MKLVDSKDIQKVSRVLHGIGGDFAAKLIMHILKLNKLNKLYSNIYSKDSIEFIDSLLDELSIKIECSEEDLKKIPKDGSFITVSNHPFGGIDGIILIKLLSEYRKDYKVMANFLLQKIEPLKDCFMGVNPFENRKISSSSGLKQAINHIQEGNALGIFPAGEVSTYQSETNKISDKQWQPSAIKLIKNAKVPVVPIYFQGGNSIAFHLLGFIHPMLRTVKLPSELLNKKNKVIRVRIGSPISLKEQDSFDDIKQYGRFLRAKTYLLEKSFEVKKFYNYKLRASKKAEDIVLPQEENIIIKEIKNLPEECFLFKSKNYHVYCAPASDIPKIIDELGRLREETFRIVGEGTNRSSDNDEFDLYYNHLFIWDDEAKKIVGAYRVGKGKDILEQYGINGFYLQTLFKIDKRFNEIMSESLELGRSFIVKEYQRKPLPLFLLWKGILYFLIKNPDYRYLIGPVSISGKYSKLSKGVIIKFIMANYFNYDFGQYIKPRTKFKADKDIELDINLVLQAAKNDIKSIDKFIGDIEASNENIPVLLKKYLSLNASVVGFNIDPKFNSCLDGLIVLDLFDVPSKTIESLSKELNDIEILNRFSEKPDFK